MPTETENQRRITRVKRTKALNKIKASVGIYLHVRLHARVIIAFLV